MVTVKIPNPYVEKLSSRAKARGEQPARGWSRCVGGTDRTQRGGYAFLSAEGTPTFLSPGEMVLPPGAVVLIVHYDDDAKVCFVAPDGTLLAMRDPATGAVRWVHSKKQTVTLCDIVDAALSMSMSALLRQSVEGLRLRCAAVDATDEERQYFVEAEARLKSFTATASETAPSPAALDRSMALIEIQRLMALHGIRAANL